MRRRGFHGTPEEHDAARVRAVQRFQEALSRPQSCDSALEAFRAAVVRHRETRYIRATEHVDRKLYLASSKEDMELARGFVKRACGCGGRR